MRFAAVFVLVMSLLFSPVMVGCGGGGGAGVGEKGAGADDQAADPMKGMQMQPPPGTAPGQPAGAEK